MVKLLKDGEYKLVETKDHVKILMLDDAQLAWIAVNGTGEILVTSHNPHKVDYLLATGKYRLYEVKDEPKLVDQKHLELHVGRKKWQGYLLPTGLPTDKKKRARIIATKEIISAPKGSD
ncbi:hypothetical protein COU91_01240 [Candidatus Saccharibacteria bacterium CG10_big_fil_rev_8_21_14_0_10_47_8]|nr:MAG: hypothetical protein COU91_01240 [Candidatus Saccharibacteria bacterium CG10_big_fil_rev_8_21_14_0_10_47_8]